MVSSGASRPPGLVKPVGQAEAKRNAEALFETKTVAEIREIEARTRKDIEQKKLQLRQLVGESYKDLIENADKIVSVARNSESILANIKGVQDAFSSLAHSFATADTLLNEKRDSLTKHEELYAVGSRIKYLVDTPELIWGCLDSQQYLEAARRYLRAEHVYTQLHANFPSSVLAKFPLLRHHWPTVTKFKKQITDAVQANLSRERVLSTAQAADAVVAVAALQGMDSAGALQVFLAGRRAWLQHHLSTSVTATKPEEVAVALCELAQAIQLTVSQIGELFLASNTSGTSGTKAPDAACRLQATAREDEVDASELMFGGRAAAPALAATGSGAAALAGLGGSTAIAASPEVDAWRKANRAIVESLVALSSGQVEKACMLWLRDVCEDFGSRCKALLACCTAAEALVGVEAAVRSAIATWQHPSVAAAASTGALQRSTANGGSSSSAAAARRVRSGGLGLQGGSGMTSVTGVIGMAGGMSGALSGVGGGGSMLDAHLESWEAACEWVLGRPLNLWQEVFHGPFVVRAKELIETSFAAVAAAVEEPLTAALAQAASAPSEPAGTISAQRWPQGLVGPSGRSTLGPASSASDLPASQAAGGAASSALHPSWSEKLARGGKAGPGSGSGGAEVSGTSDASRPADRYSSSSHSYRHQVELILQRFDAQLLGILQATHKLVGGADVSGTSGSSSLSHASSATMGQLTGFMSVGSDPMGAGSSQRNLLASMSVKRDMAGSRAADLEPYVQQQCSDLATRLAGMLQAKLAALPQPAECAGTAGAVVAEQVLLLGRLASALGSDSRYLAVVLGPPEGWRSALAQAGAQARGSAAPRAATAASRAAAALNTRLQGVVERLRGVSISAYRAWAQWAAGALANELQALVLGDGLLSTTGLPLSWQETVIATTGQEPADLLAEPLADMRFHLPATPSCAVLQYLMAGCQEVRRAGDHRIAPEALQILEWELAGAALKRYRTLLQPGAPLDVRISERGVLQLLFDVRLLRDVLAGARPLSDSAAPPVASSLAGSAAGVNSLLAGSGSAAGLLPGAGGVSQTGAVVLPELQDPSVMAALSQRRKEAGVLEQQLQDRLDPIDWATYESYLWANVQKYYARSATLFGLLVQLQRVHPDAPGKALVSLQDSNALNVLPVVQRFQYLPISAPLTGAAGMPGAAAPRPRLSLPSLALSRMESGPAATNDLGGSYSFADLGSSRTTGSLQSSSADSTVGGSSTGAFMARLQAGPSALGTLGSLLGDKAAEMTAMAQQKLESSFTDFLPTSALLAAFQQKK